LSFGGQTALNCGLALEKQGVLKRYRVRVLGTPVSSIELTEDRTLFAKHLAKLGLKTAKGQTVRSVKEGRQVAKSIGLPVMIRSGFALGGSGSGVARTEAELVTLLTNALSTNSQVII